MKKCLNVNPLSHACREITWHTRFSIWWLRNFEDIIHFWTGFSWVWAFGVLLFGIVGYMPLFNILAVLFLTSVALQCGLVLCIRSISAHLKTMEEGPEKELAHNLMIQIINRRLNRKE
jgi:hypothetical protein